MGNTPQPREVVAQIFQAVSIVLGIPSAIVFIVSAWVSISLYFLTPQGAVPSSPTGNLMIDGLVAGASLVGKTFSLANRAAEWVIRGLAVFSLCLTLMATVLFAIARGLHAGRGWARILGLLLALAPMMISILICISFRKPVPIALGATVAFVAGYTIWVLGWRFA